jgi:hypothetical protein
VRTVRSPADPADFETTLSRAAIAPLEFAARASGTDLLIEILEPERTAGRAGNTSYRVVFIPSSLLPANSIRSDRLDVAADLGDPVVTLGALNDGGRRRQLVPNRSADRGWYAVVPVGQRGVAGAVVGLARSPWGT